MIIKMSKGELNKFQKFIMENSHYGKFSEDLSMEKVNELDELFKGLDGFKDIGKKLQVQDLLNLFKSYLYEQEDTRLSLIWNAWAQLNWISKNMEPYISEEEMRAVDRLLFAMDIQKKALEESIYAIGNLIEVSDFEEE